MQKFITLLLARLLRALAPILLPLLMSLPLSSSSSAAESRIMILKLDGAIGPATADYVTRGIARAALDDMQLVVIIMDTPGGLDMSMRTIIKSIIGSPVAIATFVSPSGARAASAGTYILYASHIAAMAPGTNVGAATPVRLGGSDPPSTHAGHDAPADARPVDKPGASPASATSSMTQKQVNDAAAYIRSLAQMRGRNAQWGEMAVREAASLSADEALRMRVIDVVADDVADLLKRVDGRRLTVHGKTVSLRTAGGTLMHYAADWRVRLLTVITDPSMALILLTIGIYGLIFEFTTPGLGVGGVLGGISLLVGLYALQLLPVNYAGLALILLGLGFMIAEAYLPSLGMVGLGGVAAFVTGAIILIDTDVPGFGIPISVIVLVAVMSVMLVAALVVMALRTRRLETVSGASQLIGSIGEIVDTSKHATWARLQGELWKVTCPVSLQKGQKVLVLSRTDLLLEVKPVDNPDWGEKS